ncbi:MAG: helix-turn-helix transcriptional regulator [Nanoarchaeales archaeon]|nr:helix-turn-helix transcriptional regulator [Nanoarchaeales archaeon]
MKCKNCPIWNVMDLLGKKWNMFLIKVIRNNPNIRFNEILVELGINPRTLTLRLCELEEWGIINKKKFNTIPPRVEYSVSEIGEKLFLSFKDLDAWAKKYVPESKLIDN